MKTLEERLREKRIGVGSPWLISIEGEAPRKVFSEYIVRYDDAIAIVADAPRIYRGEEMVPGHWYWCLMTQEPIAVNGKGMYYDQHGAHPAGFNKDSEVFGPLPTNSPGEGQG